MLKLSVGAWFQRKPWYPRTPTLALVFGTRNDCCTCTAWGSSEAFVCLFVAVFLHRLWFNQFWGVSLTDPLTPV